MNNLLEKILEASAANLEIILITGILLAFAWHFILSKKLIAASMMLSLGLYVFFCLDGILSWISGLGGDSFLEANIFDINEAYFWITTFISLQLQILKPLSKTNFVLLLEAFILSAVFYVAIKWKPITLRVLNFILLGNVLYIGHLGYGEFQVGREYIEELKQQFDHDPQGFKATEDIDLFVYIGESTSTLYMSLYGYPLKTTPRLDELFKSDPGFLRFEKIRSTHTHTSPSLVRALTVTSPRKDVGLVQWGIGSVLKQSGLTARLYSIQPLNGSFATFSRFVFEGVNYDLPSDDRYKGNYVIQKLKDHQLLEEAIHTSGVVFFHSYAGHGTYLENIETTLSHEIEKPAISFNGIFGASFSEIFSSNLTENVAAYNQAITYIDQNVSHAIENIRSRSKPAVLIYFSDHGESVYTKRGHDSSNYIDEMTSIPVILYFNDAYQNKYPDIFLQYRQATLSKRTKLLDQISPTILELLRIQSSSPLDVPTLASTSRHPRPYILERKTFSGLSRIDLDYNTQTGFSKTAFFGGIPDPTYISILNEAYGGEGHLCYHRSNSYAKVLRAASVSDCLEFDLVVDGDKLNIYHPPKIATGLNIEHIFSIAQARKNSLWIDAKNINDPTACMKLTAYLEKNYARVGQLLVEFPWVANKEGLADLRSCSERLRFIGVRTSYYVPTHLLMPCAENPAKNSASCKELDDNIQKAIGSGMFTDLSFDFLGYPAMMRIKDADKLNWNTWLIKAKDFYRFPVNQFGFIIMDSSADPNTY